MIPWIARRKAVRLRNGQTAPASNMAGMADNAYEEPSEEEGGQ
jgi:hypothetical protein